MDPTRCPHQTYVPYSSFESIEIGKLTLDSFTAVVLLNVLGFFDPLRALIKNAMGFGFIKAQNGKLMTFVDCPPEVDPATFDWGAAALSALDGWRSPGPGYFVWTLSSLDANSIATY